MENLDDLSCTNGSPKLNSRSSYAPMYFNTAYSSIVPYQTCFPMFIPHYMLLSTNMKPAPSYSPVGFPTHHPHSYPSLPLADSHTSCAELDTPFEEMDIYFEDLDTPVSDLDTSLADPDIASIADLDISSFAYADTSTSFLDLDDTPDREVEMEQYLNEDLLQQYMDTLYTYTDTSHSRMDSSNSRMDSSNSRMDTWHSRIDTPQHSTKHVAKNVDDIAHCLKEEHDNRGEDCPVCGKHYANKGNLTRHLKLHSGFKPFVCQDCGKRCCTKSNMESHLRVHEKPLKSICEYCGDNFRRLGFLKKHTEKHALKGDKKISMFVLQADEMRKQFEEKQAKRKHGFVIESRSKQV